MTVLDIKDTVMFQTNNDVDDIEDFLPYLIDYINDGYDRLAYAWAEEHVGDSAGERPPLRVDTDTPMLPEWTHKALADWATWMIYRNGNAQKQSRGYPFRAAFDEVLQKVTSEGGKDGKVRNFFNIP